MAKVNNKILMKSTESAYSYTTVKPKGSEKLQLKSYDPVVRRHVLFNESKLK